MLPRNVSLRLYIIIMQTPSFVPKSLGMHKAGRNMGAGEGSYILLPSWCSFGLSGGDEDIGGSEDTVLAWFSSSVELRYFSARFFEMFSCPSFRSASVSTFHAFCTPSCFLDHHSSRSRKQSVALPVYLVLIAVITSPGTLSAAARLRQWSAMGASGSRRLSSGIYSAA